MTHVMCSISRSRQAHTEGSCQIFFKCQSPPRHTPHTGPHVWVAAAWYFIYLYSTFSKKDLRQLGVRQIFAEWLQATLSSWMFFLSFCFSTIRKIPQQRDFEKPLIILHLHQKKFFLFNFKNLNYKIQAHGKKLNHHKKIKWKVGSSPHIQSPHPEAMFKKT